MTLSRLNYCLFVFKITLKFPTSKQMEWTDAVKFEKKSYHTVPQGK